MMIFRALLLLAFLLASPAQSATVTVGPGDSIQSALFAARPGDIIIVQEGRYYEHLQVSKAVTLRGSGAGANSYANTNTGMPVLDATSSGSAITLKADGITVEGFKIINAGSWPRETSTEAGIKVLSGICVIKGNDVSNNFNGILIQGAENNTLSGNVVRGNLGFGISLKTAHNNSIINNSLVDNVQNANDDGLNMWDRNYYSDYDNPGEGCTDSGDGFCQGPHAIPGGGSADEHARARDLGSRT